MTQAVCHLHLSHEIDILPISCLTSGYFDYLIPFSKLLENEAAV